MAARARCVRAHAVRGSSSLIATGGLLATHRHSHGASLTATLAPRRGVDAGSGPLMHLTVNGSPHDIDVPAGRTLVDLLRDDLGLTGTKEACSVGVCGACTVLVDGRMVASCIMLAAQVDGAAVVTIEGVADGELLHPLQRAFVDAGGLQCGICTPGQVVAAKALLDANPAPTEDEIVDWMMGNLCRCTGYYQIREAITEAARASECAR